MQPEAAMGAVTSDQVLVDRIRAGDSDAWRELVERYEGRLLAFVEPRVTTIQDAEDIVQETFVGFALNLANFDNQRDLRAYLFAIAAHKLKDWLRRKKRRPWDSASSDASGRPLEEVGGKVRSPSTIVRSREGHMLEEEALTDALRELVQRLKETEQYDRLKCIELLFVRGWRNKDVAAATGLTEQQVANIKFQTIRQLRSRVGEHPALKTLEKADETD